MSTVLVVDDTAVDRNLVSGLLGKNAFLNIHAVASGTEALATLQRAVPDVVVTDLVMPEMDGLELVAAIRSKYPLVPVILMTSQGNEEIAVRALQEGAASYVPKRLLAKNLLDTVQRVLAVSGQQRGSERLLGCITTSQWTFSLENDCTLIPPLVGYLQENLSHLGLCDEAERTRVGVALEEALTNALYHGNLDVSSQLLEDDEKAYYELIQKRRMTSPYQNRHIDVRVKMTGDEAVFVVRDEGAGFDSKSLPDPTDPANIEKVSGRGILLMRTFMDDLKFNAAGNEVTMTKKRVNGQHPHPLSVD